MARLPWLIRHQFQVPRIFFLIALDNEIFKLILEAIAYFIMKLKVVCTH